VVFDAVPVHAYANSIILVQHIVGATGTEIVSRFGGQSPLSRQQAKRDHAASGTPCAIMPSTAGSSPKKNVKAIEIFNQFSGIRNTGAVFHSTC